MVQSSLTSLPGRISSTYPPDGVFRRRSGRPGFGPSAFQGWDRGVAAIKLWSDSFDGIEFWSILPPAQTPKAIMQELRSVDARKCPVDSSAEPREENPLGATLGHLSMTDMRRALMRYELYSMIREVKGSIVECGVREGKGLRDWANLTQIFDPFDFSRTVIGVDTFEGFPSIATQDEQGRGSDPRLVLGGMSPDHDAFKGLVRWIEAFNLKRPLAHIPKVELVRGDACETLPRYIEDNPHLLVSLLFLDFDIYEPTAAALQTLMPRMPAGAILVFDELNQPDWPGETAALLEHCNLRELRLRQFPWEPNVSYAVV